MKILVINSGSSSIKYKLFDMSRERALVSGSAEKIGEDTGILIHKILESEARPSEKRWNGAIPNHREALQRILDHLLHPKYGVIQDKHEINAVGHRVVHGGEAFKAPIVIGEEVIAAIEKNIPLAPLHNPPNLTGIEVAKNIFPGSPQVAVFDTAFHQSLPPRAYMYALPYELYKKHGVRRYGFHGTSHSYVAGRSAAYLNKPLNEINLITIHLGNGASMAALEKGRCIDTSMGMTPLEGLVMGTRSGDVDPALPFFLANHLKMSLNEIDALLNKESGLRGICGTNDMREVLAGEERGDVLARIALDVYAYRIKKYIGAYLVVLGEIDALVFTAGIGTHSRDIRERCCKGLGKFGIEIDPQRNMMSGNGVREINTLNRHVKILVVPTDEELKIAQETKAVIEAQI